MTTYSQTEEVYKGLPYTFRCRVFGKYDKEFNETSPNRVNKSYTDLTDYDGFKCNVETKRTVNVIRHNVPTISDTGIVSGFSKTNYLTITSPDLTAVSKWRVYSKIYITTLGKYQFWFQSPIAIGLDNTNHMHVWRLPSGDVASDFTFSANTWYWVLFEFTGSAYKGYYKTAETDEWTEIINVDSTDKITYTDTETYIGLNPNNTSEYFYGSIDLTEERLEISSQDSPDTWTTAWTGTTEQFKVYDFSQTILPWKWGYQNKLQGSRYCLSSTEQSKTYYSNQINGTITGTLTTNSSRAMSGFSSSNYLTVLSQWNPSNNPWKIHLKITTGATDNVEKDLFGQPTKNFTTSQLELVDKSLKLYLSSNMSSWDIAKGETCSIDLEPNTTYDVDVEFTGTSYTISVDGVVGLTLNNSTPVYSGSYPLILGYDKGNNPFTGSVHLGESYIEFNGKEVWRGMNKETVPSMSYGKTIVTTNNVYVINGYESLSAEASSQPLDTSATNPRYLGKIDVLE